MIIEIIEKITEEVLFTSDFKISEFQLGNEPYQMLKKEVESTISNVSINIYSVNNYKGIPVKTHPNDNAIMFVLELKTRP